MHTVTIILASLAILYILYKLYSSYGKPIMEICKITPLGTYATTAPPAYEHNDPKQIPMISLNLR